MCLVEGGRVLTVCLVEGGRVLTVCLVEGGRVLTVCNTFATNEDSSRTNSLVEGYVFPPQLILIIVDDLTSVADYPSQCTAILTN